MQSVPVVADAPRAERRVAADGLNRMSLADALALGPAPWDRLAARVEAPSPFASFEWHRAWADWAGRADRAATQTIVVASRGGLDAVLPLRLERLLFHRLPVAALTWAVGDVGCPDHMDVLASPDADLGPVAAALDELPWDVIVLGNLAPNAPGARRLCEALARRGHRVQRRPLWPCPYLDLSDDWERYLATLTPTRRQTLRRKERNLQRQHALTITDYDADRLEEGWGHLVTLHERRWEGAGSSSTGDPWIPLHRRFSTELAARGQVWLTTLDLDGTPAAAWYGFTWRDTVYFYQSGRDPRWEKESVGQVLMGAMIRRAIERGYRRFDFLRGRDPYKRHWTESERLTEEITVFRRGWRGLGLRMLEGIASLRT